MSTNKINRKRSKSKAISQRKRIKGKIRPSKARNCRSASPQPAEAITVRGSMTLAERRLNQILGSDMGGTPIAARVAIRQAAQSIERAIVMLDAVLARQSPAAAAAPRKDLSSNHGTVRDFFRTPAVHRRSRSSSLPLAICIGCGCDDDHACVGVAGQPCGWAEVDRVAGLGLCTECTPTDVLSLKADRTLNAYLRLRDLVGELHFPMGPRSSTAKDYDPAFIVPGKHR